MNCFKYSCFAITLKDNILIWNYCFLLVQIIHFQIRISDITIIIKHNIKLREQLFAEKKQQHKDTKFLVISTGSKNGFLQGDARTQNLLKSYVGWLWISNQTWIEPQMTFIHPGSCSFGSMPGRRSEHARSPVPLPRWFRPGCTSRQISRREAAARPRTSAEECQGL